MVCILRNEPRLDGLCCRIHFLNRSCHAGLTPDDIQRVAEFPIVPIEDQHGTRMVLPRECFLISKEYADDHHYRRIFTFVDFGEPGNKFLEHCGVRTKPECSDIVDKLIEDPWDFLKKTHKEGEQGAEKYVDSRKVVHVLIVNTGISPSFV